MAQTAPSSDKVDNRTASANPAPPDEQFWQHYSPHGEFPLSSVGSLVIHLLIFGLIALLAWLGVVLFNKGSKSLPVEAVRLNLGGGGGSPRGSGEGPNNGPPLKEATEQQPGDAADRTQTEDVQPPPNLDANPTAQPKTQFEDTSKRRIQAIDAKASKTFRGLRDTAGRVPGSKPSSYGQGGTGTGGGSGGGEGKGIGEGKGEGPGNLTKREKRSIRWTLLFNTFDNRDYVSQLQGLGAVLAIPTREHGDDFEYAIVRNLSARPAKVSNESIDDVLREVSGMIRWIDDNPRTAAGVISALGLPIPKISPEKLHFLACMPERTEAKLLQAELAHLHKRHPNLKEEDIFSTKFRLNVRGGKCEPVVSEQTLVSEQRLKK